MLTVQSADVHWNQFRLAADEAIDQKPDNKFQARLDNKFLAGPDDVFKPSEGHRCAGRGQAWEV